MAKVQITIEDEEGKEGAVHMDYKFDPDLPNEEGAKLTPAQTLAMNIFYFLQKVTGSDETETTGEAEGQAEGCSENAEEGTCCGGGCHNS